jgi:hypothetical protein
MDKRRAQRPSFAVWRSNPFGVLKIVQVTGFSCFFNVMTGKIKSSQPERVILLKERN